MFEYIVIIGLLLIAGTWILNPLLKNDQSESSFLQKREDALRQLNLKKEGAFAAIREMEFDLNMGKLSDDDYESLKKQYELDAVHSLKEIDEIKSGQPAEINPKEKDIEDEIEREISALRENRPKRKDNVFCTQCGARTSPGERFCSGCGSELKK